MRNLENIHHYQDLKKLEVQIENNMFLRKQCNVGLLNL